jgi:2-methylisocitrate lyase-like PEP mutase family enzyme
MTMSQAEKANAFRALHEGPGAFVIPNPYDVGTARILAGLGFQALATTSAGCAFGLGRRDGAITRDEALTHAMAIVEATPLPVSADLENGFGDAPKTVAETVRLAADTGLAGCSIEDATGDPERPIYELAQAVERVAAAVEAARSLPFEPIRTLCGAVSRPVNVLASLGPSPLSVEQIAAAGARRISVGGALSRVALGAFLEAARELKERGSFTFMGRAASMQEISTFMLGRSS